MANFCPECGIDLRGVEGGVCPTCGTARPRDGLLTRLLHWIFGGGRGADSIRTSIRTIDTTGEVASSDLDSLPADVREHIAAAVRDGRISTSVTRSASYTFIDLDGVTREYRSLEEMPPDVRAMFEDATRKSTALRPHERA